MENLAHWATMPADDERALMAAMLKWLDEDDAITALQAIRDHVVPNHAYRGAVDALRDLADEAAKAVAEPRRFDQQQLSAVLTRARHHLRGR